jgi:hypothetical protein
MSDAAFVTDWIRQLQAAEQAAFQKLWEGYFRRLVGLARQRRRGAARAADDEDDVPLTPRLLSVGNSKERSEKMEKGPW